MLGIISLFFCGFLRCLSRTLFLKFLSSSAFLGNLLLSPSMKFWKVLCRSRQGLRSLGMAASKIVGLLLPRGATGEGSIAAEGVV